MSQVFCAVIAKRPSDINIYDPYFAIDLCKQRSQTTDAAYLSQMQTSVCGVEEFSVGFLSENQLIEYSSLVTESM